MTTNTLAVVRGTSDVELAACVVDDDLASLDDAQLLREPAADLDVERIAFDGCDPDSASDQSIATGGEGNAQSEPAGDDFYGPADFAAGLTCTDLADQSYDTVVAYWLRRGQPTNLDEGFGLLDGVGGVI